MSYWLLKTDPETYSIDDLVRDKETVWDGVSNPQALSYLRQMKTGDGLFIYHTGKDKCIMGSAVVSGPPRPDPKSKNEKLTVVTVTFKARARSAVTLQRIKNDTAFADFALVRNSRLSVMPVTPAQWKTLASWAGLPA